MVRGLLTNRPYHLSIHHHDPGNIFKSLSAIGDRFPNGRPWGRRRVHSQRRCCRPTELNAWICEAARTLEVHRPNEAWRSIVAHTFARPDRRTSGEPVQIQKTLGMPLKTTPGLVPPLAPRFDLATRSAKFTTTLTNVHGQPRDRTRLTGPR
jgi:hypothetical protein